jgi:hypothetical protein
MTDMTHRVTAPVVTVETNVGPGRARVDYHAGATLPADVPAEDIGRLLSLGHIAEAAPAAEQDPPHPPPPTRPAASASKAAWVAYAVALGADQAAAEAKTRDQLVDAYGKDKDPDTPPPDTDPTPGD